jgi:RNA polymerase sigma factor (sigma-70 family)
MTGYQSSQEEARLICEVLEGRKDLFGDLLQPHLTSLLHFVRAKMRYDSEADDIIQTTVLKALTRLDQFRFEATFRTWLMAIALKEIQDWRRRRVHSRFVILDPAALSQLPIADQGASPLRECQRRETVGLSTQRWTSSRRSINSSSVCGIWRTSAFVKSRRSSVSAFQR